MFISSLSSQLFFSTLPLQIISHLLFKFSYSHITLWSTPIQHNFHVLKAMTSEYHREQDIYQSRAHATLSEAVSEHASKVGYPIKLDAEFETVTESEREKLDKQVFPDNLFTGDINLAHSKKAFLNIVKGLDDFSQCEQLWSRDAPWLQPQTTAGMYTL